MSLDSYLFDKKITPTEGCGYGFEYSELVDLWQAARLQGVRDVLYDLVNFDEVDFEG